MPIDWSMWSLLADGLEPAAIRKLCLSLRPSGFKLVVRDPPAPPQCELQVTANTVRVKTLTPDDRRSDRPIELSQSFTFADADELHRLLSPCVGAVLERATRYWALVKSIRSNKTIAFVGSGLSVEAGYPNWNDLLKTLVRAAGLVYTADELAAGGKVALEIAENCKKALPNYHAILEKEFSPRAPGYTGLHVELLSMPFASYLTTNFDPCLEVAAEQTDKKLAVQIAPAFTISYLSRGDIFYLHGRVPRIGQVGECRIEWLRLTTDDYKQAYQEDGPIAELIEVAMKEQNVFFFVGYGLREEAVREVLNRALLKTLARKKWLEDQGLPLGVTPTHFALVPRGEMASKEVSDLMESCNVQIIEFSKEDYFMELKKILTDLFYRTRDVTAPSIRGIGQFLPSDGPNPLG